MAAVTITELMTALRLPTTRIDRRPATEPGFFECVYMIEVVSRSNPSDDQSMRSWADEVQQGVSRVIEAGGKATVLGIW